MFEDNFLTMFSLSESRWRSRWGSGSRPGSPARERPCTSCTFPWPADRIFLTKLSTGIGLLLVCTLLPILIYATWAALPGTHPGPFEWSMTGPAFQVWLLLPLAYLGAFASGIRPARWFGSRLLPLVSVGLPASVLAMLSPWWLIAPHALARGGGARQRYPLGSRNTRFLIEPQNPRLYRRFPSSGTTKAVVSRFVDDGRSQ